MDIQRFNVLLLGIAFHLIFFSFQTSVFVQQTVVNSIKSRHNSNFEGDGYISLCITYSVFAVSNWLAPSIISVTGVKYGMFFGALTYMIYSASFINPTTVLFYSSAALIGFGAGILWTAQGSYLSRNSDENTSSQNAAIFWSMLQSSILFGNLFVYFSFSSKTSINDETRHLVYSVLTIVCALGVLTLLFLRDNQQTLVINDQTNIGAWGQFMGAIKLAGTIDMIVLSLAFMFTGQLLSFFTGVYGTAIGATTQFGSDAKRYIGLSGISIGVGEILGGSLFGFMGPKVNKAIGRSFIFTLGYVACTTASILIFINLPADSSIAEHSIADPIIIPRLWIALLSSALIGLSDACFNTQVYSLLMSAYDFNSIGAFALFKFVQSLGSAVAFLYSTKLNMHHQLYLLTVMALVATLSFCFVDQRYKSKKIRIGKSESKQDIVNTSDDSFVGNSIK